MQAKALTDMDGMQLPNIPIKIVRQGDRLKLTAGDFTLELNEIDGKSQTYPLLVLDKFITEATTTLLRQELKRENIKSDIRKAFMPDETQSTDDVIQRMTDIDFGSGQ